MSKTSKSHYSRLWSHQIIETRKIQTLFGILCFESPNSGNQTIVKDAYKFHGVEQMRVEFLSIMHHEHMRCIMNIHDPSWMQMLRRGYSLSIMSTRNASKV